MMQAEITDKATPAYQRIAWEALKKSLNGLINKVNVSNIEQIVRELFQENIVRGRSVSLSTSMLWPCHDMAAFLLNDTYSCSFEKASLLKFITPF